MKLSFWNWRPPAGLRFRASKIPSSKQWKSTRVLPAWPSLCGGRTWCLALHKRPLEFSFLLAYCLDKQRRVGQYGNNSCRGRRLCSVPAFAGGFFFQSWLLYPFVLSARRNISLQEQALKSSRRQRHANPSRKPKGLVYGHKNTVAFIWELPSWVRDIRASRDRRSFHSTTLTLTPSGGATSAVHRTTRTHRPCMP